MGKSLVYANGVIAVKEKSLLKNKIVKMCALSPEEAFRTLKESGFGDKADAASVYEYERLLASDMRDIDEFIREYAVNFGQKAYFFAERDFHNMKALLKAEYLNEDAEKMLAPDGLYGVDDLKAYLAGEEVGLSPQLESAADSARRLFETGEATGAALGVIFERAKYDYLLSACRFSPFLKRLISERVDRTNILTVMRANTPEYALDNAVSGGKIPVEEMLRLFGENEEAAQSALDKTYLKDFWRRCYLLRRDKKPFSVPERETADIEVNALQEHRFELKGGQPFLYYIFRRRAENLNVRILLSCLIAGMPEGEIVARLRAV